MDRSICLLGVQIVDSLGVRTLGLNDQVYGPTSNILSFTAAEVDSVSRKRDLTRTATTARPGLAGT